MSNNNDDYIKNYENFIQNSPVLINGTYLGFKNENSTKLTSALKRIASREQQMNQEWSEMRSSLAAKVLKLSKKAKAQGYKHGVRLATEKALNNILESQKNYEEIIKGANEDCLELALSVANEVIGATINKNSSGLIKRINEALANLLSTRSINILVNPNEFEFIRGELLLNNSENEIKVFASNDVDPGNAILETISGLMEIKWQDHFDKIKDQLLVSLKSKFTKG